MLIELKYQQNKFTEARTMQKEMQINDENIKLKGKNLFLVQKIAELNHQLRLQKSF